MKKSHIATLIVFLVLIPLTLILGSRLSGRAFYVTSTLVIVELLIPFFLAFEGRRPQARELVVLAVMCGIFSAGMSFAMNAAKPMHEAAAALGVDPLYVALPSYVVIMGGGAIINLGFCFIRLAKVKDLSLKADFSLAKPLIIHNVLLSALGGLMWYLQFFFYAWGHARIPAQYDYISWMLHMSFYVLCGGIVGLVLKEWNNAGRRPVTVLSLGCVVIIVAANIVGIGMAN